MRSKARSRADKIWPIRAKILADKNRPIGRIRDLSSKGNIRGPVPHFGLSKAINFGAIESRISELWGAIFPSYREPHFGHSKPLLSRFRTQTTLPHFMECRAPRNGELLLTRRWVVVAHGSRSSQRKMRDLTIRSCFITLSLAPFLYIPHCKQDLGDHSFPHER